MIDWVIGTDIVIEDIKKKFRFNMLRDNSIKDIVIFNIFNEEVVRIIQIESKFRGVVEDFDNIIWAEINGGAIIERGDKEVIEGVREVFLIYFRISRKECMVN